MEALRDQQLCVQHAFTSYLPKAQVASLMDVLWHTVLDPRRDCIYGTNLCFKFNLKQKASINKPGLPPVSSIAGNHAES